MTPERAARLVAGWARAYTRGLPGPIGERRIGELEADLHDHIAHERARGVGDAQITRSVLSRMVRGLPADASWRRQLAKAAHRERSASRAALRVLIGTGLILLVPLVAMALGDDVVWGPVDFALAGALLAGTGLVHQAVRRAGGRAYRIAAGMGLASALLLVWATLALGVIGAEGDRADLMYAGVLAVGLIGAVGARLRPRGMARAMFATALSLGAVAAIAVITGEHRSPVTSVFEIVGLNAFFAALFAGSGLLFRHAAGGDRAAGAGPATT